MRDENSIIKAEDGRQYQIFRMVGDGTFSEVYLARMTDTPQKEVLLKAYRRDVLADLDHPMEQYINMEMENNRLIRESGFAGALTIGYTFKEKDTGSVFGVMEDVRLGMTLRDFVNSSAWKDTVLSQRLLLGKRIFDLIHNFHLTTGLSHGDIRPDNVYLYETGMGGNIDYSAQPSLIDFGLSFPIDDVSSDSRGWEMALECLWFILTGKEVDEYPITEENLNDSLSKLGVAYVYSALSGETDAHRHVEYRDGSVQVIADKMMHDLFQTGILDGSLCEKLDELYEITKIRAFSKDLLYRSLRTDYESMKQNRFGHLDIIRRILPDVSSGTEEKRHIARAYSKGSSDPVFLHQLVGDSGRSYIMIGDGGIGKTTSLVDILDRAYGEDEYPGRIVIFMELCVLSQNPEDWYDEALGGIFIEQFISSLLENKIRGFAKKDSSLIALARGELFRENKKDRPEYVILLDGLNETGFLNAAGRRRFYDALNNYLENGKNMQMIITGRSDAPELAGEHLDRLTTAGLDDKDIKEMLLDAVEEGRLKRAEYDLLMRNREIVSSAEYRLWTCLKVPFFLSMYCALSDHKGLTRRGEILKAFFHDKRKTLAGIAEYGEKTQAGYRFAGKYYGAENGEEKLLSLELAIRVILDFIVPEIALHMASGGHFFMTAPEIRIFLKDLLPRLSENIGKAWTKTEYGYGIPGASDIIEKICEKDSGESIPEYACGILGIMRRTMDGALFFTHQYFRDYFAACAIVNHMHGALEKATGKKNKRISAKKLENWMYPLHETELSESVCSLAGEILGEHYNMPVYDSVAGRWIFRKNLNANSKTLEKVLDLYRGRALYDDGRHRAVRNLVKIAKCSRIQNIGKSDLTGFKFDGLDLAGISLHDVVLSRCNRYDPEGIRGDDRLRASFKRVYHLGQALLADDKNNPVDCMDIHPLENRILLYDHIRQELSEINLDNGETTVIAVAENLLGARYRPDTLDVVLVMGIPPKAEREKKVQPEEDRSFLRKLFYEEDDIDGEVSSAVEPYFSVGYCVRNGGRNWQSQKYPLECLRLFCGKVLTLFLRDLEDGRIYVKSKPWQEVVGMDDSDWEWDKMETCHAEILGVFSHVSTEDLFIEQEQDGRYLIGDAAAFPFTVGLYDVRESCLSSVLSIGRVNEKPFTSHALAPGTMRDEVLYIDDAEGSVHKYRIAPENFAEYEYFQNYDFPGFYSCLQERICPCPEGVLVLFNGDLGLFSTSGLEERWHFAGKVRSFQYRDGLLLASTEKGVYKVDVSNGAGTCIRASETDRRDTVIGRSDMDDVVVVFDNRQTVKWIDARTGKSLAFSVLRDRNIRCTAISASGKDGYIYAVSGRYLLCWDAFSGEPIYGECEDHIKVDVPDRFQFERVEFTHRPTEVIIYSSRKDYRYYPPMRTVHTNKRQFIVADGHLKWASDGEEDDFGDAIHMVTSKERTLSELPYKKMMSQQDWLGKAEEVPYAETEAVKKELKRRYYFEYSEKENIWDAKVSFDGYEYKVISSWKTEHPWNSTHVIDVMPASDKVVGYIGASILYSDSRYSPFFLKLANPRRMEAVEIRQLADRHIKEAFMAGKTAVFFSNEQESSMGQVLFWDSSEEEVYEYSFDGSLFACGITPDSEDDSFERATVISEGIWEKKRDVVERARRIHILEKSTLNDTKDRMHTVNYPVLILGIAMMLAGIFIRTFYLSEYYTSISASLYVKEWGYYIFRAFFCFTIWIAAGVFIKWLLPIIADRATERWRLVFFLTTTLAFLFMLVWPQSAGRYLDARQRYEMVLIVYFVLFTAYMLRKRKHGWTMVLAYAFVFAAELILECITQASIRDFVLANILMLGISYLCVFRKPAIRYSPRGRKVYGIFLAGVPLAAVCCFALLYRMRGSTFFSLKESWEQASWVRDIWRNAALFGGEQGLGVGAYHSYVAYGTDYFLACTADRAGILPCIVILVLYTAFFILLFRGVRVQEAALDRQILRCCTLWLLYQAVENILANFGLLMVTREYLPLSGVGFLYGESSVFVLIVYLSFYGANSIRRRRNETGVYIRK